MPKLKLVYILFLLSVLSSCTSKMNVDYVNPFIGTKGKGNTFQGVSYPFGMMHLSPVTRLWDDKAMYNYSDTLIYGFGHSHSSCSDSYKNCNIVFMPFTGNIYQNNSNVKIRKNFASSFSHKDEKASPGYYSVKLPENDICVELTCTERSGFQKYSFTENENSNIFINLLPADKNSKLSLKYISSTEIQGFIKTGSENMFFVSKFSYPFNKLYLAVDDTIKPLLTKATGKNIKAIVNYKNLKDKVVYVKTGISFVSIKGALNNLNKELPWWNFQNTRINAKKEWEYQLNKIKIVDANEKQKTVFYTALYYFFLSPDFYIDVDRNYIGTDFKQHSTSRFNYYRFPDFSNSLTAKYSLYSIIDRKRSIDFAKTLLTMYKQKFLVNYISDKYISEYDKIPVVTDFYIKGIDYENIDTAYNILKDVADKKYYLYKQSLQKNYTNFDNAYNDWCVAQMAKKINEDRDYNFHLKRSKRYEFVFNDSMIFRYGLHMPHDIKGLINKAGGKEIFSGCLDRYYMSLINDNKSLNDYNEIFFSSLPYLYYYVGQPWKSQKIIRYILKNMCSGKTAGLQGYDNCGQISAWYLFNSIGFYPKCLGDDTYFFAGPSFKKIIIYVGNKRSFIVKAKNLSDKNIYIQSVKLNTKPYSKNYIRYQDIMKGGELVFVMGNKK